MERLIMGLNYKVTHQRLQRDGWTLERALIEEPLKIKK